MNAPEPQRGIRLAAGSGHLRQFEGAANRAVTRVLFPRRLVAARQHGAKAERKRPQARGQRPANMTKPRRNSVDVVTECPWRVAPAANKTWPACAHSARCSRAPGRGLRRPSPPALGGANPNYKKRLHSSPSRPPQTKLCQGHFVLAMCLCAAKLGSHVDFWGELLCSSWNRQAEAGAAVYRHGGA